MNKTLKRKAVIAAGTATVLALAAATPSFAHMRDGMNDSSATTKFAHVHATIAGTVTAVPTTVTDVRDAARGAKFVAYKLDAAATELPATQPTTGGKPLKVMGTAITDGVLTGTLKLDAGANGTITKYAIYNAAGAGTLVTVTVDAAGVATATATNAITATYVAPTAPALGEGKSVKGEHRGRGGKKLRTSSF
ncbi:MAG: hypothetical protein RL100_206 [Actinomycetota bacterium]|jgi:hypothetical protein